ncbi:MAG: tetratricopeptide repeat-containing sensor histidine kinase [Chitinophagales bacterium]|nr:tetratricopeptide repeat-containing sensor histidine kinase [Chitinophagales bacterium]
MSKLLLMVIMAVAIITFNIQQTEAQTNTDSLRKVIATLKDSDTNKVLLTAHLAQKYYHSSPDSQYNIARRALSLASGNNYYRGVALALTELGSSFFTRGLYDSAIASQKQALIIINENKIYKEASPVYTNIANALFRKGLYSEALIMNDSALNYAERYNQNLQSAKVRSNIANIYYKMGNYTQALDYYLQGLKIQEREKGNKVDIATDLSNIANIYARLSDYKNALSYNSRALAINRAADAKNHIIGNLTTNAIIYNERKLYDSSLIALNEAYTIATQVKNEYLQNLLKGNMAEAYMKKGDLTKALALYQESLIVSEKLQDAEGVGVCKAGIGEVLFKQGNTTSAIGYLKDALGIMQQIGVKEQARDISGKLADIYEHSGDFANALTYFKINQSLRDSLSSDEAKNKAEQMVFNYEIEKKQREIEILEKDKALAVAKANNKNILLFAAFLGIVLAAIIAMMFFRNAQRERRRQAEILAQKEEIETQADRLKELNDFKDVTFSVLSHDLRSPVNALTGTMMMLDEKLMTPEEFSMHKNELNNKLQSVSLLLENMLYWAQSRMKGEQKLDIEKLSMKRKALKTIAVLKDAAMQKNITLTHNIPEELIAYGDANQIDIVFRNLVSNAIKFTPDGGTITISGYTSGNTTQVSFTDTGVGMTDEQLSKLFSELTLNSTRGTGGEKGTGLGLQLCYEFIKKNGGDIVVSSTPGKGSTFTITLPNKA